MIKRTEKLRQIVKERKKRVPTEAVCQPEKRRNRTPLEKVVKMRLLEIDHSLSWLARRMGYQPSGLMSLLASGRDHKLSLYERLATALQMPIANLLPRKE